MRNANLKFQDRAWKTVRNCESDSKKLRLFSSLAHCYEYYALHFYYQSRFAKSACYFRMALKKLGHDQVSSQKTQILILLARTLLKSCKFRLADKYGSIALKKASQHLITSTIDTSLLKIELEWERGLLEKSFLELSKLGNPSELTFIHTTEQLSAVTCFYRKAFTLSILTSSLTRISDNLKTDNVSWLEYLVAAGFRQITLGKSMLTERYAKLIISKSLRFNLKFFELEGSSLLLLSMISQEQWDSRFDETCDRIQKLADAIELKKYLAETHLAKASRAYASGDFLETVKYISKAERISQQPSEIREVLSAWRQTICGNSPRLGRTWKSKLVASVSRLYFKPTLEVLGDSEYIISHYYTISLADTPILDRLLQHLLHSKTYSSKPESIQQLVWKQSTNHQGWQQKIRNAINRLRSIFTHTIAPLILYEDNTVRIFQEAIDIKVTSGDTHDCRILQQLEDGPQSTVQLSRNVGFSKSKTKRILKRLITSNQVKPQRVGRSILYTQTT